MNKRLILIIVGMLIIVVCIIPSNLAIYDTGDKYEYSPPGIWFVFGVFRYLDDDEEYYYVNCTEAKLLGIGFGIMWYELYNMSIGIEKPFYGFLPSSSNPRPGFCICTYWKYL